MITGNKQHMLEYKFYADSHMVSVSDSYSLNPDLDPAKNLNPEDP